MSSPSAPSTARLTIEEVLKVFLIAFNAAVAAFRPISVTSFGVSDLGNNHIRVTLDRQSHGQVPVGTSEALEISYKKLNLCDTFCTIFYDEVEMRLHSYDVNVDYAVLENPRPTQVLHIRNEETSMRHSILVIRKQDESEIIFDGTAEQFGWPATIAIISGDKFWPHYTRDGQYKLDLYHRDMSLEDHKEFCQGYWHKIGISLREMLQSLNWAKLEGMATGDREDYVRGEATQRARDAAKACWG
ncbi:uncharacterized protein J4E92_005777 [Alternaria infectoria]|uniref:uncharacterized protein n=1 Tax=Alternaria infectoria TaxID=45303 RepID=UPI0022201130|nr:uncharacterized protein J4E92_005777 [Alternaria infectoria]KAI4928293.1 hypothetical protein J4E92_005777 [Alternaria infectoria]